MTSIRAADFASGGACFRGGLLLLLYALNPSPSWAASPSGESIAKAGNGKGSTPCLACHGPTGQGMAAAGYPRLAGLDAAYVARQLESFRKGTRTNAVMSPVAKALDDRESKALGIYFASLPPADEPAKKPGDPKMVAAGEAIAQKGAWDRGLPACAQCHGARGLGVGEMFPQLAGQAAPYIANQLDAWRSGTRYNDAMNLMRGVATKLSPVDIQNVANYYANLSAMPPSKELRK